MQPAEHTERNCHHRAHKQWQKQQGRSRRRWISGLVNHGAIVYTRKRTPRQNRMTRWRRPPCCYDSELNGRATSSQRASTRSAAPESTAAVARSIPARAT